MNEKLYHLEDLIQVNAIANILEMGGLLFQAVEFAMRELRLSPWNSREGLLLAVIRECQFIPNDGEFSQLTCQAGGKIGIIHKPD